MTRDVKNAIISDTLVFLFAFGVLTPLLAFRIATVWAQEQPAPSAAVKKDIEILTLKAQLTTATKQISDLQAAIGGCQAQLGPLALERNQAALGAEQKTIIETYEKANPGFTLDPGTWKPVKKPEPAKPKG